MMRMNNPDGTDQSIRALAITTPIQVPRALIDIRDIVVSRFLYTTKTTTSAIQYERGRFRRMEVISATIIQMVFEATKGMRGIH